MRHWKRMLFIFTGALLILETYLILEWGLPNLLFLPLLIIAALSYFYLHKQIEKDDKKRLEKGISYAIQEIEAEKWMKNTFVPKTISYSEKKRKKIIFYFFFLIFSFSFLWGYTNNGILIAFRDSILTAALFWLFIYYVFNGQALFNRFLRLLPENIKKHNIGDWGKAYFFLFPIIFFIYLLYPVEKIPRLIPGKLQSLPVFILIYNFSFLCLYSIILLINNIRNDEKKQLEKEIKRLL